MKKLNEETATKLARRYYEEKQQLKHENARLQYLLETNITRKNEAIQENIKLKNKIMKLHERIFYLNRLLTALMKEDD